MMDRAHKDIGKKVAAIADDAIAELFLLGGVDSADAAAELMACMAIVRIEDNERRKAVRSYAHSFVWDHDDTGGAQ